MPEPVYVALALTSAVAITASLRAIPFLAQGAIKDSRLLNDLSRWLPLGAVTILSAYCVSQIDYSAGAAAAGPLIGIAVTAGVHLRWRNIVLSITLGTVACLLVTNLL